MFIVYPQKSWRFKAITHRPYYWRTTITHSITEWGWISWGRNGLLKGLTANSHPVSDGVSRLVWRPIWFLQVLISPGFRSLGLEGYSSVDTAVSLGNIRLLLSSTYWYRWDLESLCKHLTSSCITFLKRLAGCGARATMLRIASLTLVYNCWVLRSYLVQQCSYPRHWPWHQQRFANCDQGCQIVLTRSSQSLMIDK